ncbi:MAG: hypothetical protein EBQ73_07740 [Gammaproteobacteria bacterium]|nr:hypothetical protein [Gammaproteobacteria bacterium]
MAVLPAKSANGGAGMTLEASLDHVPEPLRFGTSGRRGLLIHLTPLEVYINATAELEYLKQLPPEAGGIRAMIASSSPRTFVPHRPSWMKTAVVKSPKPFSVPSLMRICCRSISERFPPPH